jgi:hypothetical protein
MSCGGWGRRREIDLKRVVGAMPLRLRLIIKAWQIIRQHHLRVRSTRMTRLIELPAKNVVRLLELLDVVLEVFARVELDFSSFECIAHLCLVTLDESCSFPQLSFRLL